MFSSLSFFKRNFEIDNNTETINNSYNSSKYKISKLHKWHIINNIKKQESANIAPINGHYDLKKSLFWKNGYLVIPDEFLNKIHWTRCRDFDIYNIHTYKKNCKLYNEIMKKLNNSNLKLEKVPEPLPRLSNLHRQYLYFKRNENKNNLLQSKALMFLIKNNYILVDDINNINNKNNNNMYFEAYQALELATELCHINRIKLSDISFTHLDTFILSNHNNNPQHLENECVIPSAPLINTDTQSYNTFNNSSNINNTTNLNNNNTTNLNNKWLEDEKNYYKSRLSQIDNNMICLNPEHHNIKDKVEYYSNKCN